MELSDIGPSMGSCNGIFPKGWENKFELIEYEHLRLCLGGGEDGLIWVIWWWKVLLDGLAMVDGSCVVGKGMGVTPRGGDSCACGVYKTS